MSQYTCPSKLVTEAMVISGMSGRFPDSDSTDEFAHNLYNNVDLITDDNRRWPTGMSTSIVHTLVNILSYLYYFELTLLIVSVIITF